MKIKSLIFSLTIGLLIGFSTGYIFVSQTEEKGLQQRVVSLKTQISELQFQLSSLGNQSGIFGVYFSPKGGCENQVIYWISRSNVSVHVLIYSFTTDAIGDALMEAYERGVEVRIVFEKSQISQYSEYSRLKTTGIPVRNDTNPNLMHNKIMIIDGVIVLTGSFNWSNSAEENNNENLIVINSTYIANIYKQNSKKYGTKAYNLLSLL